MPVWVCMYVQIMCTVHIRVERWFAYKISPEAWALTQVDCSESLDSKVSKTSRDPRDSKTMGERRKKNLGHTGN